MEGENIAEKKEVLGGKWLKTLLVVGIIICAALALVLGLGLGLGLKNEPSVNFTSHPPSVSWRRDPQEYVLSNDFNTRAASTTRQFTLNLTEIPDGAPDGVSRRLLLINGRFPGPVIEANEGDRLEIQVNNFMTLPATIHWHGQYQNGMARVLLVSLQELTSWTEQARSRNARYLQIRRSHTTSP
jgi:FtsP/CotA-like multicopper oxidase with cupredoxin domain